MGISRRTVLVLPSWKEMKGTGRKNLSSAMDVLTTKTQAFQVLLIFFYNFLVVLCKIAEWIHELMRSLRTSAIKRCVKCPRFYFKHNAIFPRRADEKILSLERRSTCRTPREPQSRNWNRTPVLNQFYPCHRCLGLSNPWIYFFSVGKWCVPECKHTFETCEIRRLERRGKHPACPHN